MGKPVIVPILTASKRCLRCGIVKPSDNFGRDKRATDRCKSECKPCRNAMEAERRQTLSPEQLEKLYQSQRKYQRTSLTAKAVIMFNSVVQRCKKNGREVAIDRNFIEAALKIGRCWATGLPFRYAEQTKGGQNITPFSPSIDRQNSKLGYVPGNVQFVCSIYNLGKGHHDELDFIAMCMAVAERNKYNQAAIDRLKELREI